MRLRRIEIEGYRSIRDRVIFDLDSEVTVLLGANDHGKTNILSALKHLNDNEAFKPDLDLNWDRASRGEAFPELVFHFVLDQPERDRLYETLIDADETVAEPGSDTTEVTIAVPAELVVRRKGVAGILQVEMAEVPPEITAKFWSAEGPRVELLRAQDSLPDSVTFAELSLESHEFMRGIFYYAGIDPASAAPLFNQDDTSIMRLKQASAQLNETLRSNWTQGRNLRYELTHGSGGGQILLRIEDPDVRGRVVRASHRSSGFTHFFTLKTMLHARKSDYAASAYLFLFDEPGIFLHPSGQYDLLKVLDEIGRHNQVVYSTHSLFMINKTFPTRHRLIAKTGNGTQIDQKPFVGRWGKAIEALGLSLAGTILFAQHVLLAEGDADPMLIEFMFQRLAAANKASIDLNAFSVISTGESNNTDALIRILKEGGNSPNILVLVDGDKGGQLRLKRIQTLLKGHDVKAVSLDEGLTTEDYLPAAGRLYPEAMARYVGGLVETMGEGRTRAQVSADVEAAATAAGSSGDVATSGIASWAVAKGKAAGGLKSNPSKVGIAREYIAGASEQTFTDDQWARALQLLQRVQAELQIPAVLPPESKIEAE